MTALLAGSPALAQMEPGWELELSGGWFQDNPLDVDDINVPSSGPSVDLAWMMVTRASVRVPTRFVQNYPVRGSAGWRARRRTAARNRPRRRPPEVSWSLAPGVERESDVVEFDDQGSTRCAACAAARSTAPRSLRRGTVLGPICYYMLWLALA